MSGLEIRNLTKHFNGEIRAVESLSLRVRQHECLAVVGPSGSGKTTLLRLVAGLEAPTSGAVLIDGIDVTALPPHKRRVGMVFQSLALYAHLTVGQNLAFDQPRTNDTQQRITEVADLLGIRHLVERYPGELSGGEQQRVALGRALVGRPAILLLDEPLSSLDAPQRRTLRRELKRLQAHIGVPMVYVTHNQEEALALGDRVAVLNQGRLEQVGTPHGIYHQPASRFVAEFFGPQGMNLLEGTIVGEQSQRVFLADGWLIDPVSLAPQVTGTLHCGFRPESLFPGHGKLSGCVQAVETFGDAVYVQVELPAPRGRPQSAIARQQTPGDPPQVGSTIPLTLDTTRLHWFDRHSGHRL